MTKVIEDYHTRKLLVATTDQISDIFRHYRGTDYAQCANCGSFLIDARKLAVALSVLCNEALDLDSEQSEADYEIYDTWLRSIIDIGYPEECFRNTEYFYQFLEENEYRQVPEIDDFEYAVYINFENVILKVDTTCECFRQNHVLELSEINSLGKSG